MTRRRTAHLKACLTQALIFYASLISVTQAQEAQEAQEPSREPIQKPVQAPQEERVKESPPLFSGARALQEINAWLEAIHGLTLTYSVGSSTISASAGEGQFTEGEVARGVASSSSLSLSLYRHPSAGWAWDTEGGADYLSSELRDFESPNPGQELGMNEREITVLCQTFDDEGRPRGAFGPCDLSGRYQLRLISLSYGLWGGYHWLFNMGPAAHGHLKLGASWRALNLRWQRAVMGDITLSDELAWSWLGVLQGGALLRLFFGDNLGLGLSVDLEYSPRVSFTEPIEFRGARDCREARCQRERVFVDQLSILSPRFGFHLIWTWSSPWSSQAPRPPQPQLQPPAPPQSQPPIQPQPEP